VLAKKLGMTRVYSESRVHNGVTVLRMPDSLVLGHRIESKDGYNALILGFEGAKIKSLKKPQKQFYAKAKKRTDEKN
jgi:large subunit ribosomal protein L3